MLAIICAKGESTRFPNKNKILLPQVLYEMNYEFKGKMLLATDSEEIAKLAIGRVNILMRPKNISRNETSVFDVARWAYNSLNERHKIIIVVLPNVIDFQWFQVDLGIKLLKEKNLNEVRTYNYDGTENGIIIMREDWFLNGTLSVYCGAIISDAYEIHRKSELPK